MNDSTKMKLILNNWTFTLHFGSDIVGFDEESFRQTVSVQNTLTYLSNHQAAIKAVLVDAIRAEYDNALKDRDAYDPAIIDEVLPLIHSSEELLALIEPVLINVFKTAKDDFHYVGFEFACTWDFEHGLGILTYLDAVIERGEADVALLEWRARRAQTHC